MVVGIGMVVGRTHGRYWPICNFGECPQLGRCWGLTGHQAAGRLMSTLRASSAERDQVRHWRHITLGFDFFELMTRMIINPAMVASAQIDLFNDTLSVWQRADDRMLMRRAHEADAPKDKRFKHPEWSENAISILSAVREVKGMDDAHPLGCFLCWPSPNGYSLAMIAGIVACPSTILPPQRSPGRPPCWSHSFIVTRRCSAFCPPSELDIEEPRVTTE